MTKKKEKSRLLQTQLRRLLLVLALITGLNALFFWKTLDQLFTSYRSVAKEQKISILAGDLERSFFEESKFRNSEPDSPERQQLQEVRKQIKTDFKQIRDLVNDKSRAKALHNIQNEWQMVREEGAATQLLILIRSFIKNEQATLGPLEANAQKATQATIYFLMAYVSVFVMAVLVLSQFIKRRVFVPLERLSENMKNFQAGQYQLTDQTYPPHEIGYLESQFHKMGRRINQTVEELKEIDRVKTDFISVVSHELRTPMTSVKGSLSLILSGSLDKVNDDVKQLLVISQNETDRLIRLINDILDLTKIDAQKLQLEKKWHSLGEIIDTVVQSLKGLYDVAKVSVKILPAEMDCKVLIDRDRIQQVITNLLSNAVKFSPADSAVEISYKFDPVAERVTVFVADHGPGLKPEDQSRIFEKFRSRDLGKNKIMRGTGLGLPICKALVEQHGGEIGLRSTFGAGSTFYFSLPQAKAAGPARKEVAA